MTCASEATGTASPASANEIKITEEARRIPIPSRLSIVIARLRAKCREIKAHLMIVDRSREPAFVARTASRFLLRGRCRPRAGAWPKTAWSNPSAIAGGINEHGLQVLVETSEDESTDKDEKY